MENVTFLNSFEIVTCGMLSNMVALFFTGSFFLLGTLGEEKGGIIEERPERSICLCGCQILEPRCASASSHRVLTLSECYLTLALILPATIHKGQHSLASSGRSGAGTCLVCPMGVC